MKTPFLLLATALLLCFSCDRPRVPDNGGTRDIDATASIPKKRDCCFKTQADFEAAFPGEVNGFTYLEGYGLSCSFDCAGVDSKMPKASRTYVDPNGEWLHVNIDDYSRHDSGWQKRATVHWLKGYDPDKIKGDYMDLEKEGVYSGYVKADDKNHVVNLYVQVDNRFLVSIYGVKNTGIEGALLLFETLDARKLAKMCK